MAPPGCVIAWGRPPYKGFTAWWCQFHHEGFASLVGLVILWGIECKCCNSLYNAAPIVHFQNVYPHFYEAWYVGLLVLRQDHTILLHRISIENDVFFQNEFFSSVFLRILPIQWIMTWHQLKDNPRKEQTSAVTSDLTAPVFFFLSCIWYMATLCCPSSQAPPTPPCPPRWYGIISVHIPS